MREQLSQPKGLLRPAHKYSHQNIFLFFQTEITCEVLNNDRDC